MRVDHDSGHTLLLATRDEIVDGIPLRPSRNGLLGVGQMTQPPLYIREKLCRRAPNAKDTFVFARRIDGPSCIAEVCRNVPPEQQLTSIGEQHVGSQHDVLFAPRLVPGNLHAISGNEKVTTHARPL